MFAFQRSLCLQVKELPLEIQPKGILNRLVHPILEYGNAIWGPHFILDQQKIEKVQHRTTHLISTLKELLYAEHLSSLNLPSLHYRRWG